MAASGALKHHFRFMAGYHRHCTARVLRAVADAGGEDWALRDSGLFFRSVMGTLNHLLGAEQLWFARLTGDAAVASEVRAAPCPLQSSPFRRGWRIREPPPTQAVGAPTAPPLTAVQLGQMYALGGERLADAWERRVARFTELRERLLAQCDAWIRLVDAQREEDFHAHARYVDTEGNPTMVVRAAALSQVFNHGTHHRGQITAAFSAAGLQFPSMDMQSLPGFEDYGPASA